MRKKGKKLLSFLLAGVLCCLAADVPGIVHTEKTAQAEETKTQGQIQNFRVLSGNEMMEDMGAGWNLGNTMDGHTGFTPGETTWQHVKTTKKLIKKVHDMGFHTVRIPVTWGTMIDDNNDYAIDEKWINRVQDIVDYCVSLDMYAIINIHHDGAEQSGWLRIATSDQEGLKKKYAGVWKNIATYFKNYDEHLIFESMNEVTGSGMTVVEENEVIMTLNQLFLDTVRATGANNAKRWLMVPGKYNYIDSVCNTANKFSLPKDTVDNRLIVSVHIYTPNSFCLKESTKYAEYSVAKLKTNDEEVKPLYDTYTSKGIPVVVGEYGCINKDNPTERAFYLEGMNRIFKKYKCVGVYWDQGWYDRSQKPDYSFAIIDRETGQTIDKEVTDALMRGYAGVSGETDYSTLQKSPMVKPITSLEPAETSVEINADEWKALKVDYAPADSNDVILWESLDESIATVSEGNIHGKRPGSTKIIVHTQNGNLYRNIDVTVKATPSQNPCTEITVEEDSFSMDVGASKMLAPVLTPADTEDSIYFASDNENVVTVSSLGKVVAVGSGEAKITLCSSSGVSKEITVTVNGEKLSSDIRLAVNVYYNDEGKSYFANEVSSNVLTVGKDGQYTLDFDCERDLSQDARKAGVTSLENMTAIYIKDYDVTSGVTTKSPLQTCNIRYDAVKVNDVALKVTQTDKKSALKDSGIFDTNDPINSWDGCAVEGVEISNKVASFKNITNPKKISITFTLSDMRFGNFVQIPKPSIEPSPSPGTTPKPSPGITPKPSPGTDGEKPVTGFQVKGNKYKVKKAAGKKQGAVTYIAPNSKKVSSVSIPSTVSYGGKKYQVTAIGSKTFFRASKLKKVTIGKHVAQIGSRAFYGCKKLKSICIKTKKLTNKKVGSKAFKGISKKATIKVPKTKKKAYKKILLKKGVSKKVRIK